MPSHILEGKKDAIGVRLTNKEVMTVCCRIVDMRDKQVICIRDGTILGCVCDVEIDTCSGKLMSIIVWGRARMFGLFGRREEFIVRWDNIEVIGQDSILVNCEPPCRNKRGKRRFMDTILGNPEQR